MKNNVNGDERDGKREVTREHQAEKESQPEIRTHLGDGSEEEEDMHWCS